ncbi:Alkaline ceramidase 3 [Paramyrothecium foliicola]|nr:Alkaline ceramidase 3 [Paramyrothecium foliicola]
MTQSATPFWGPQTSYLKCLLRRGIASLHGPVVKREVLTHYVFDQDYVLTRYVAEFINTISSLVFVAYGAYGLSGGPQSRTGSRLVSYCGLMGVGICSAAYHMTLKYHTQMSDELSMHLLTTPLIYRVLTFKASPQYTKNAQLILSALFAIVMVVHMVLDEFLLHATAFGLAVYIIVTRVHGLVSQHVTDPHIRRKFRSISRFGCYCFALGYILWLIDDWACRHLTSLRHDVGVPIAFLLELHGWWHVLTAIGGYTAVVVIDLITTGQVHQDPTSKLAWPVSWAVKLESKKKES